MFKPALDRDSTFKPDESNVYASVLALPAQIKHAQEMVAGLETPAKYKKTNRVVIAGMGGSALGARVVKSCGANLMRQPLEIVTDYHLPPYVDSHSLVILSSYSGNTEEVLSVAKDVRAQKALPLVITTGGKLAKLASRHKWPALIFEPKHNPSNQPRMALGYNLGLILASLEKLGLVQLAAGEFEQIESELKSNAPRLNRDRPQADNGAKKMAEDLKDRAVILIAGQHLVGAVHAFKNQLNENAKTFSCLFALPELNHHLLEGLAQPRQFPEQAHFVLFDSELYSKRIATRLKLTEEVIQKQGYGTSLVKAEAATMLTQAFEAIQFGSYVSLYLALLYGTDPAPIPWVDYFKQKLR